MSHRSTITAGLATAALALTGALPPFAAAQDLRSPDARDVAAQVAPPTDLRSPDARDVAAQVAPPTDLRSPDARDVTRPRTVAPVRIVTVAGDGFDWSDAAIGAGISFGVAFLLGGSASMVSRRRAARRIAA
jgi:hypothetical protein